MMCTNLLSLKNPCSPYSISGFLEIKSVFTVTEFSGKVLKDLSENNIWQLCFVPAQEFLQTRVLYWLRSWRDFKILKTDAINIYTARIGFLKAVCASILELFSVQLRNNFVQQQRVAERKSLTNFVKAMVSLL